MRNLSSSNSVLSLQKEEVWTIEFSKEYEISTCFRDNPHCTYFIVHSLYRFDGKSNQ